MENDSNSIPKIASAIAKLLQGRYCEKSPLELKKTVTISRTVHGTGYLDWIEFTVVKVYPDQGYQTLHIICDDSTDIYIVNTAESDGVRKYFHDEFWSDKELRRLYDAVKESLPKPSIYHLSQTVFYAEPDEETGSNHTYNILYTRSLNRALATARRILLSMPSLTLMKNETVFPNGTVSYTGEIVNYKKGQPGYRKALKVLLDELKYRGFCTPDVEGEEHLQLNKAEIDKEYQNFYNRAW